jgi:hypothetical protein
VIGKATDEGLSHSAGGAEDADTKIVHDSAQLVFELGLNGIGNDALRIDLNAIVPTTV